MDALRLNCYITPVEYQILPEHYTALDVLYSTPVEYQVLPEHYNYNALYVLYYSCGISSLT